MKVLILGCGPAGLLAAHAAAVVGKADVTILSEKKRSPLFGCQYLHSPIPGLDLHSTMVKYEMRGTPEDYAQKVYSGTLPPGARVSPEALPRTHRAWDIRQAYDYLWSRYESRIMDLRIQPHEVQDVLSFYEGAHLIVNSIPLNVLCQNEAHLFTSRECWALGDAPERGQRVPIDVPDDTVWCDGTRNVGFYRAARVFGHTSVEWPRLVRPPIEGVVPFRKPLATTCTCWLGIGEEAGQNPVVLRVGRYGRWEKGVLAHHAFDEVARMIGRVVQA